MAPDKKELTMFRALLLCMAVVGLGATLAVAADPPEGMKTHDGVVVSAADGKLTMSMSDGSEHSHMIGANVAISINGQAAKLTDLKKGDKITVTTDNESRVTAVSCMRNG
ncbi:MAG: hypothetical protein K8T91_12335 [Planctomycetes bacterium]|nr:hypothetical protein [Planctomycetota bacterium]